MGFLDSLGAGLRRGGSALAGAFSDDVYREQSHERGRVKEDARHRRDKTAEIMLRAVNSGQIPADQVPLVHQALTKLGYDLPIEAFGVTPEAREKLDQYGRDKVARERKTRAEASQRNWYKNQAAPGLGLPGEGLRAGGPAPIPPVALAPPGPPPGVQASPYSAIPAPQGTLVDGYATVPPDGSVLPPQTPIQEADARPYNPNALTGLEQPGMDSGAVQVPQDGGYKPAPPFNPEDEAMYQQEQARLGRLAHAEILAQQQVPQFADELATPPSGRPAPVLPDYPAVTMNVGEVGQMPQQTVTERRLPAAAAQEPMVPGPVPGRGPVPASLMDRWPELVEDFQAGDPVAKIQLTELFSQMYPSKKDLIPIPEGGQLYDPVKREIVARGQPKTSALSDMGKLMQEQEALRAANPNDPRIADYDRKIRDSEEVKEVRTFNAMLDAANIMDPGKRQTMWAEYASRKGTGGSTNVNFGGLTAGVDAAGNPVFVQGSNKGGAQIVEGIAPPPKEEKPLTEAQGKASSYGLRAKKSDEIMTSLEANPDNEIGSPKHWALSKVPGGNYGLSSDLQKYNQAAREFISAAVLRSDSGATVTDADYAQYYPIYFPVPGNSKEVRDQKAASRRTAIEGLDLMAGIKGQNAQQREQAKTSGAQTTPAAKQRKMFKGVEYEEIGAGRWRKVTK